MKVKFELNEETYHKLFDSASDAIWIDDTDGTIKDMNRAMVKLTGYTCTELVGRSTVSFLNPESIDRVREIKQRMLKGEAVEQSYEQRIIRKNSSIRSVKIATNVLHIDGKARLFQHVARDVSEEKLAREMLSETVGGSPIPTFVINQEHKVTHWNKAIESLSGIGAQEMIGTDEQWRAFYTEKRPTVADLIVDRASASDIESHYGGKSRKSSLIDGAYEAEGFFSALGGTGKWLHFTASPLNSESGQIMGAIETLEDITEEKQLQKNMRLYVQLITKAQEEERKRIARELHDDTSPPLLLTIQRLDSIASQASPRVSLAMKKSLEDLRNLAIEALEGLRRCAQDLRPRILDDLGLIPALEWMAEALANNFGIDAHVEIAGTERNLSADTQMLLFRIAQEALSNIRRHSGASKATVKMEFETSTVRMTVTDDGKGFELPFQTESLASAGKLGIIGMQERARLLGGNLEIRSEPGKGTQVMAVVPMPD